MKNTLSILLLILVAGQCAAQDYKWGIGVRGAFSHGITLKHKYSETNAFEIMAARRWRGIGITALYEKHIPVFDKTHWNFYLGFGGHVGSWVGKHDNPWFDDGKTHTVAGVDGILGLEYNFKKIPINLSIDYKPAFNIFGYTGFWGDDGAFSIRYIF